jgi:hypothetical protein
MTRGETVIFQFQDGGLLPVPVTGLLVVYRWSGEKAVEAQTFELNADASAAWTAPDSANFAWSVTIRVTQPLLNNIAMVLTSGAQNWFGQTVPAGPTSHLGHKPMPGISARITMTHLRVNGAAIMVSPDAAELVKGGRICGAQIDTSYQVESFVSNANGGSATNTVINLQGSDTRDFKRGGYGFHKPYTMDAYEMQTPFKFNVDYSPNAGTAPTVAQVSDYVSFMEPPDGWVMYAVQTPQDILGGTGWPGGIAHITYTFSVEYKTNDVWIGKEMPRSGPQTVMYDETMSMVGDAVQFHDNPFHVSDLLRWYNAASPIASASMPVVAALLSRMGPQGAALAALLRVMKKVLPGTL